MKDSPPLRVVEGGSPSRAKARAFTPLEKRQAWLWEVLEEARVTMPPDRYGDLMAAALEDAPPAWAKAELERLDKSIRRRKAGWEM
jgi:hypothetical protein